MRALVLGFLFATTAVPVLAIPQDVQSVTIKQHWECVPIARALSGIQIFGNAHTWWDQAEGRYRRGNMPRRGAVMAFKPFGSMRLGHVAAVSRVIDDRTVLLTHSNWSIINGKRGQIERNVKAVDVSMDNDWSRVKVWYAPTMDLGTTVWPVHGFIYPDGTAPMVLPDNARVASTMAGPVAKSAPAKRIIIADKADLKSAAKAERREQKIIEKEEKKRLKTAEKKQKYDRNAHETLAPTGRLDYLEKLLKKVK